MAQMEISSTLIMMGNRDDQRHDLENTLVKSISDFCLNHMKNCSEVISIDGLFGVTVADGHTFLFNIKEKNEDCHPQDLQKEQQNTNNPDANSSTNGSLKDGSVLNLSDNSSRSSPVTVSDSVPSKRRKLFRSILSKNADDKTELVSDGIIKFVNDDGTEMYSCTMCSQVFKNKSSGTAHSRYKHFNIGSPCNSCGKLYRNDNELREHEAKTHSILLGKVIQCDDCGEYFETNLLLKKHIAIEHSTSELCCKDCGKVFKTSITLKEHILMTHQGGRFACHLCGQGFRLSRLCREHLASKHPYCPECGMSVFTLEGHICSTTSLGVDGKPCANQISSSQFNSTNFKLGKKALGDLAKSVVAQLCDDTLVKSKPQEKIVQNIDAKSELSENIGMRKEKLSELRVVLDKLPLNDLHASVLNKVNRVNAARNEMHTQSPCSSDLDDEEDFLDADDSMMTIFCNTCDTSFNTHEQYHSHIIHHPWCRDCGKRVLDLAQHRLICRGPVPVMLKRNNHRALSVGVKAKVFAQPPPYEVINID